MSSFTGSSQLILLISVFYRQHEP